jgi:PAS domain S-box-containing protein
LFCSVLQHGSDVFTVLDADGTIRYQSPSIERVLGYKPEELLGKNAFNYVHPEDLEPVVTRARRGSGGSWDHLSGGVPIQACGRILALPRGHG